MGQRATRSHSAPRVLAIMVRRLTISGNEGREAGTAAQQSQIRVASAPGVPAGMWGLRPRSMTASAA